MPSPLEAPKLAASSLWLPVVHSLAGSWVLATPPGEDLTTGLPVSLLGPLPAQATHRGEEPPL